MQVTKIPRIDPETRSRFLHSEHGGIFVLGCCLVILWVEAMALFWRLGHPMWLNMVTVGFSHVIAGRAASIAQGTQVGLPPWLTAVLATYADTMAMFLVYPILVFCYENFVENLFFEKHMRPLFESAQKRVPGLRRYKIAGVFLFVFSPFWMTGIIVGALLGYLLGLKTWLTMVTVILGSAVAVVSWVYAYDSIYRVLSHIHPAIPIALTVAVIVALVARRVMRRKQTVPTRKEPT